MRGAGTRRCSRSRSIGQRFVFSTPKRQAQTVKIDIYNWCREQRQHLAHDQPSDNRDAQRPVQFGATSRFPEPMASPPSSAAIVVIIIGRKRRIQAS